MRRIVAIVIDLAPAWIWKSGNIRFVGAHTLHFCYGHGGRRTVEWDGHEIAAGRRMWPEEGRDENHAPVIHDAGAGSGSVDETLPWLEEYEGQTTHELIALEGRYRTDSIITAFHQALGQKGYRLGDENLTTPERLVYTVVTMEGAVNMDGYQLGLFTNNPEMVPDIVPSLRAIGADWVADLTESAIAVLGIGRPLTAESVRAAAEAADAKAEKRLDEIDQTHFARGIDLAELLLRYIKANRDQITLP